MSPDMTFYGSKFIVLDFTPKLSKGLNYKAKQELAHITLIIMSKLCMPTITQPLSVVGWE